MNFRIPIAPLRHSGLISHGRPVVLLGSCFSTNVGERMRMEMFDVGVNPFGVLYNPCSIRSTVERIVARRPFSREDLVEGTGGLHHCFDCHSTLSNHDAEAMLCRLDSIIDEWHMRLASAGVVVVTFGTAWVFYREGRVVANCHKFPASMFVRSRLSVHECTEAIEAMVSSLVRLNPEVRVIFTVSPIRHLADGAHGNQISKSTLLLAIEDVIGHHPERCIYFPAYEIMMDDLRDYRFYASDMKHPSDVAVDYIYGLFKDSFCDKATIDLAARCGALASRLRHRPITADRDAFKRFEESTRRECNELLTDHPCLQECLKNIMK